MSLETVRVSQQAKEQLSRLKRWTGIENWNILCRWAFCVSLAEPSAPAPVKIVTDSSVEMPWKVFAGPHGEIYLGLLRQRCGRDGIELSDDNLAAQFRLHLHRGLSYLAADRSVRSVAMLVLRMRQDNRCSS